VAAGDKQAPPTQAKPERSGRALAIWWYGLMTIGGFGFGILADKRPFGDDLLVHPVTVFFILVGLALIALRVLLARPVPEVISDRALVAGCCVGLVLFLVGNFTGVHLLHSVPVGH
jgi:hypothetical protein